MKPIPGLTIAGLSILSFGLLPNLAQASSYISPSAETRLVLRETNGHSGGFYLTSYGGRQWMGDITITQTDAGAGHIYYNGTFRDRTLGQRSQEICTGNIQLDRTTAYTPPIPRMKVTWTVTGGSGCRSIGQVFRLDLKESLPVPNRVGDFTAARANTWQGETSGLGTWPKWRVVSRDGELNCRVQPNGRIKVVYRSSGVPIEAETRGINAIVNSNGQPWLLTRQGCYVRANSKYLVPVSLPW